MSNPRNREAPAVPVGRLLIDAWREEAAIFRADGKEISAQRLEALAARAERAMAVRKAARG